MGMSEAYGQFSVPRRANMATLAGAAALALVVGPGADAQIEGGQRGVAPVNSDASYEVGGIGVDVRAKSGVAAREDAWRMAMREGWRRLWAKQRGGTAPGLSDGQLFAIVAGVIVEDEQVGPTRYVARLGVMFDRARAGQILGVGGAVHRSAPLLVVPVMWDGGAPVSLEGRNDWQRAWARFNTSASAIDYVRLSGAGADPLLVNAMQAGRGERRWWRVVLDSYGAADVVQPEVRLSRAWPGGPVAATFVARQGPDGQVLGRFELEAPSAEGLATMLDAGVRRLDEIYGRALAGGLLRPDPTLVIEQPVQDLPPPPPESNVERDDPGEAIESSVVVSDSAPAGSPATPTAPPPVQSLTVQVSTPDASAVTAAESSLRGTPGVQGASTTSTAVGGTSVVRVSFAGDLDALAAALRARGWTVTGGFGRAADNAVSAQAELPLLLDNGRTLARPQQLTLALDEAGNAPAHLIVTRSNAAAVSLLERPDCWPSRAMVLAGPRRSGRSVHARLAVAQGARVLDVVETRDEEQVFDAWNLAQAGGPPLLMVADHLPPAWVPRLPDLRSRLSACALAAIDDPDDEMADALLEHLLLKRGIASTPLLRSEVLRPLERTHLALVRFVDAVQPAPSLTRAAIRDTHAQTSPVHRARAA